MLMPRFFLLLSFTCKFAVFKWRDPDSNRGHYDFQSCCTCFPVFLEVSKTAYLGHILTFYRAGCFRLFLQATVKLLSKLADISHPDDRDDGDLRKSNGALSSLYGILHSSGPSI